jgi:hypothetical protein
MTRLGVEQLILFEPKYELNFSFSSVDEIDRFLRRIVS